ncbi:MAG TPA: FAD:protein FMN transferase [Candidatus Cloacimonadota bacterium]|nr:FAD:protein FMN transferase [Candidatus Cloacimonadota bacterium]
MKKRDWLHLSIIILILIFGYYRYKQKLYQLNNSQILMDTQVEISLSSKSRQVNKILDKAFDRIRMYDEKFSYYNSKSELNKINQNPSEIVLIDKEFHEILSVAQKISIESNGLYDVTIGNLIEAWNFNNAIVPDSLTILNAMINSGYEKLNLTKSSIKRPFGMKINLGSISKGYIIDKTMDYLIKQNIEEAYINAGGDIRVYSKHDKPIRIGIQHPRIANDIIATLEVSNMSVVTSGDYERFFEKDGIRYHHIINPKTGYPALKTISVTVISKSALIADGLSTTLFVMNPIEGIELVKKYPDTEAIIYYKSDEGIVSLKSSGIKKYLVSEKSLD